jgi:hypothetical protein
LNASTPSIWVVSIHDKVEGFLTFDVADILDALKPSLDSLTWVVNLWEFEGGDDVLPDTGIQGAVMKTAELRAIFHSVVQTMYGEFVGVRPSDLDAEYRGGRPDLRAFATRRVRVGILALDCSYFVVWTRDPNHVDALKRRFQDVREELLSQWCDLP